MASKRHIRVALAACTAAASLALPAGLRAHAAGRLPLPADTARRIVAIAHAELARNVRESPPGSDRGARIRTYVRSTTPSFYPNPWCAYFVSWVAREAGVPIGPRGHGLGSVAGIAAWGERTGRWHRTPRVSNVIVLPGHVGLVVEVSADHTLVSIDGNYSNRVTRVHHRWSDALGYVRLTPKSVPDPPLHARIKATPASGVLVGQAVRFSAWRSVGDIASYSWDLDGDGRFGDARGKHVTHAFPATGVVRVGLRITSRRHHVAVKHLALSVTSPGAPTG
ncbi:MAG: hypothetical protein JWM71_291 [Solirubrobacteraceae bacterium]|nr:hypothetical protein [Solirubrobacteraceae bacterium]